MATQVAHQASPARPRRAPAWTNHCPEELAFSHRAGEVYFFTAPSASVRGKVNTVAYDPTERSAHCDCFAGERGLYECWHAHHAEGAWLLHLCRQLADRLSDEELEVAGKEAAARVETASWFWAAYSPIDRPMLQACREEWRKRHRRRKADDRPDDDPEPTPPAGPAAIVPLKTKETLHAQLRQAMADLYGEEAA